MSSDPNNQLKNSNTADDEKQSGSILANVLPSRREARIIQRPPKEKYELINQDESETEDSNNNSNKKFSLKKVIKDAKKSPQEKKTGIISIVLAVLIAVFLITILIVFASDKQDNSIEHYLDKLRNQEITQCNVEAVNYFFKTYYDALSAGNTTIVEGLFDNPAKANITTEISKIVESYNNIKVYVTAGINENEIVAFVYNELKFKNINTLAPAVDVFYLTYNAADNSLKIKSDMYTDADIIKFINVAAQKDPVRSLLSETNEKLNSALESDKELKNLFIIMQSMTNQANGETQEETVAP